MQKVFSLLYDAHPLYQMCLDMRQIPDWIDHKVITERVLTDGTEKAVYESDTDRIWHLQKDPDSWYLDADLIVNKWPDFKMEKGYVYMSQVQGKYDNFIVMGNGCQSFFDDVLNEYHEKPEPLWTHKLYNYKFQDRIKPVPEGYVNHFAFAGSIPKAVHSGKWVAGYGHCIKFENGKWELKIC